MPTRSTRGPSTSSPAPDPATRERDLGVLANYVTGLVLHELALPSPDLDAAARIRAVIDTLGWPGAGRSLTAVSLQA